jgi:hypothetical protein
MSTRAAEQALTPIALRSEHDAPADGIAIGALLGIPDGANLQPVSSPCLCVALEQLHRGVNAVGRELQVAVVAEGLTHDEIHGRGVAAECVDHEYLGVLLLSLRELAFHLDPRVA